MLLLTPSFKKILTNAALGTIHARWNPVPGRFKDYIAMPKFNMYQSLHTTVIGPQGKPVELQIRTYSMRTDAPSTASRRTGSTRKKRYAAPWRRTDRPGRVRQGRRHGLAASTARLAARDRRPGRIPRRAALRPVRLRGLRLHPQGWRSIPLPSGSTPVDFAYAVHTEVGHHCIGARVNGRLVPLESKLDNGDVVEIFTSKAPTAVLSRDWLGFVSGAPREKQDPRALHQGTSRKGHRARPRTAGQDDA